MNSLKKLLIAGLFFGIHSAAMAADFDGSKALICAFMDTAECAPGQGCVAGTAASLNLPAFVNIDFKGKMITARETAKQAAEAKKAAGKNKAQARDAKIHSVGKMEGVTILQGSQHGRGWSMVINQDSGNMTLSAAGDGISFAVHGACTLQ